MSWFLKKTTPRWLTAGESKSCQSAHEEPPNVLHTSDSQIPDFSIVFQDLSELDFGVFSPNDIGYVKGLIVVEATRVSQGSRE